MQTYDSTHRFSSDIVMDKYLGALESTESFSYKFPKFVRLYLFADLWKWRILKRLGYIDPLVGRYSANH